MSAFTSARLRLFAGAVLISFSPVFVTLTSVAPTVSAFYRVAIGAAALAIVWYRGRRYRSVAAGAIAATAGAALFFALDLWFWHRSILYIGAGRATVLANLQVFFMIAAGAALLARLPSGRQLGSAALAMAGLAVMLGPDWSEPAANFRFGVGLGLLTAASYAGYLLCLRRARQLSAVRVPVQEVAAISLFSALFLGLAGLAEGQSFAIPQVADLGWLAAYGLLSHAGGVMLIASSIDRVEPAEAGIALLLQPALSYVWEVALLGRGAAGHEVAGAVLTLAAIWLGTLRRPASRAGLT